MGNAWRLKLKPRFIVPPLLWVAVVARSGSNKTAPLNDIVEPLRKPVSIEAVPEPTVNPQGRIVVSNATVEAVIARLAENQRGLLCYCNELAGWCLDEQLRVFGLSSQRFVSSRLDEVVAWMRSKSRNPGRTTIREIHQNHKKRYKSSKQAKADLDRLVASDRAKWEGKECVLLE